MTLWLIGLGLGDERDITLKGFEVVRSCHKVYLDTYTGSLVDCEVEDTDRLSRFYGRPVEKAPRHVVESGSLLKEAADSGRDVALLVSGDPLCATTHGELMVRAESCGVSVRTIHNASVMTAVAACGLEAYRFGQTITICMWEGNWRPDSWYQRLAANKLRGLHTLCLLDLKIGEKDARDVVQPPRHLTAAQAAAQLIEVEESKGECVCTPDTLCVTLARLGSSTQKIVAGTLREISSIDMGPPLHCLVIVGDLNDAEEEEVALHYTTACRDRFVQRRQELQRRLERGFSNLPPFCCQIKPHSTEVEQFTSTKRAKVANFRSKDKDQFKPDHALAIEMFASRKIKLPKLFAIKLSQPFVEKAMGSPESNMKN